MTFICVRLKSAALPRCHCLSHCSLGRPMTSRPPSFTVDFKSTLRVRSTGFNLDCLVQSIEDCSSYFFFKLKWCAVNVCRSKPAVEVLNCWDARAIFTILRIQFQTNCSNCVHLIKLRWWRRLQKISLIFWKKRFVGYILTSKWPVELSSSRDLSAIFTILMFDF